MSDEELAALRVRVNSAEIYGPRQSAWLAQSALGLIAEVERLRAENAALIQILRALAEEIPDVQAALAQVASDPVLCSRHPLP